MKAKHVIWIITGIVAVVAMAAGIAVLVDKYFGDKIAKNNYIECEEEYAEQSNFTKTKHPTCATSQFGCFFIFRVEKNAAIV